MKTRVSEVFSSIQGEGKLLGRRQIFIRFSGCNLSCNYCDTPVSRDPLHGECISVDELHKMVKDLVTPDLHSLSLTGGEPLLHYEFLKEFLENNSIDTLLETNGSLPNKLSEILDLIQYGSVDIKLPEHEAVGDWNSLLDNELKSINLLIAEDINTYIKLVVFPSTKVDTVTFIASKIAEEVKESSKLSLIIQPVSPLTLWENKQDKLLEMSQRTGEYVDVLVIPQVHKLLNIR